MRRATLSSYNDGDLRFAVARRLHAATVAGLPAAAARLGFATRAKSHECKGRFDKQLYRECNRVERLINCLKHFRRIATRYEKLADNYLAMLPSLASPSGSSFTSSPWYRMPCSTKNLSKVDASRC